MSQTFSLQGKIGLDARDFKKGAQQASDAIEDVADDLEELPAAGKKAGSQTGDLLSSGMTKAFAAAGGAALIAKGINDAMNIEAGMKRVEAQFALTADEAEHYGELGGELYADAWGESVTDATASIAKVGQQLQDVGKIADDEMAGITANVMAVADVFEQDFDSVLRSTGQLVRNELAQDAEEALDMITVAFQQGGDRAGDLLDTIDEYSQHWARLGIDGSEALGLIVEGFQQGFRDGDKLGDLFKEFAIRSLEDRAVAAFEAIGLAGEVTQDAIAAGGESAREALGNVITGLRNIEDPIEQNRLATELFGTQYEDLGPQVLDVLGSIETGLGDVEGAATDMAETVSDTTAASMEELKRRAEQVLAEIGADILPIIDALDDLRAAAEGEDDGSWTDGITGLGKALGDLPLADATVGFWDRGPGALIAFLNDEAPGATETVEDLSTEVFRLSDAEANFQTRNMQAGLGDAADAADDLADSAEDAAEEVTAIEQAFIDLRDEISDRSAYRDVQQAFADVNEAALEAADTSEKTFAEQQEDARAHAQELDNLRLEVMAYAEEVGDIPDEEITNILALIDSGKLAEAEWAIAFAVRDRNLRIQPVLQDPRGVLNTLQGAGVPWRMLATGGPVTRGETVVVGEEGPELFTAPSSGYIHSNADSVAALTSRMILPNTGSVAATTIANTSQRAMINLTVHSLDAQNAGRVIVDTLEEFYASGGRPL